MNMMNETYRLSESGYLMTEAPAELVLNASDGTRGSCFSNDLAWTGDCWREFPDDNVQFILFSQQEQFYKYVRENREELDRLREDHRLE